MMIRKITDREKLTILALLAIILTFLICLFWELFFNTPYYGYIEEIKKYKHSDSAQYELEAKKPVFLHTGAFLSIKNGNPTVYLDADGNALPSTKPSIALFIWPSVFHEAEYGMSIDYQGENNAGYSFHSKLEITKNVDGTYNINHTLEDPIAIQFFEEYRTVIEDMIFTAEQTWSFDGLQDIKDGLKAKDNLTSNDQS